jgi:hypothetical protein
VWFLFHSPLPMTSLVMAMKISSYSLLVTAMGSGRPTIGTSGPFLGHILMVLRNLAIWDGGLEAVASSLGVVGLKR